MMLQSIVPMLTVTDISATVQFYREVLDFACVSQAQGWACLSRDGVELMLALPNAHVPFERPQFTGSLYLRCDDVDEVWRSVKDKAKVGYPIENFDYGMREFAIRDNNGYMLQFGQEIG